MTARTCLITGGNSGIGKAAAIQLAAQGDAVVIACRNRERGEAALADIRSASGSTSVSLVVIDMASRESIRRGCEALREAGCTRLDTILHNAAEFDISRKTPVRSPDGVETVWAANHLGPVLLTHLLDRELSASGEGRVVTVSSKGLLVHPLLKVRLEDPEFTRGGYRPDLAYYQSKLAQVMYTTWLSGRYAGSGKTANCVRVPNVRVDLGRYPNLSPLQKRLYSVKRRFARDPSEMARLYVWLASSPDLRGVTGAYFDERRRQVEASRWARHASNIQRVMQLTAAYVPEIASSLA